MAQEELPDKSARLDLVTALSADDCVACLRRGARRVADHKLVVRTDGTTVRIVKLPRGVRSSSHMWLLRFEAELLPSNAGTLVRGVVVANRVVEISLAVCGAATATFGVLALAVGMPFVPVLALGLLALYSGYYVHFRRLVGHQRRELRDWVIEWLTLPHGRAGGAIG